MKSKYFLSSFLALAGAVLISGSAQAQATGSVTDAFQTARQSVTPDVQTKVVSVYGVGSPTQIQKWYIIFYDPTVPSHGRAVLVENNAITKTYPANGGTTYSSKLTFDPSRISSEGPALTVAQNYAAKHSIAYDTVHALLKQTANKPFRWRIELLQASKSKGYVYVAAIDDSFSAYAPASSGSGGSSASSSDDKTAAGLANDVKHTFLGIGGDLEEFFTGERTVDK